MGQVLGQLVADMAQAQKLQDLIGGLGDVLLILPVGLGVEEHLADGGMGPHMVGGGDVLEHREVTEQGVELEGAPDAHLGHLVGLGLGDVLAAVDDVPAGGGVDAGDEVEEGGLARAVGAQEAFDLPFLDVEIQVVHDSQPAKALGQAGGLQQPHFCSPPFIMSAISRFSARPASLDLISVGMPASPPGRKYATMMVHTPVRKGA